MSCRTPQRAGGCRRGFSLVEIMIVIVIIGLLAGAVTLNVRNYLHKAKQNTARQEIATLCNALETFYSEFGRYPTNEEGLDLLTKPNDRFPEPLIHGLPVDPWGRPYQYNQPGRNGPYEVICFGADGREGGGGADADLVSWQLKQAG
jgi:general secretion pathway protein G